jgi:signal transduction histidine kinase
MAQVTVADSGCGIPAADLPHIFERFYRGRNGRSSTGLGLSIVKWIVEEHHGEITVASEPGQGASFTIRLPIWADGESSCADQA